MLFGPFLQFDTDFCILLLTQFRLIYADLCLITLIWGSIWGTKIGYISNLFRGIWSQEISKKTDFLIDKTSKMMYNADKENERGNHNETLVRGNDGQ